MLCKQIKCFIFNYDTIKLKEKQFTKTEIA